MVLKCLDSYHFHFDFGIPYTILLTQEFTLYLLRTHTWHFTFAFSQSTLQSSGQSLRLYVSNSSAHSVPSLESSQVTYKVGFKAFLHHKFSRVALTVTSNPQLARMFFVCWYPIQSFNVCFCLSTFCTISSAAISRDLNSKILKCKPCRRSEGYVAEILFLLREARICGNLWLF